MTSTYQSQQPSGWAMGWTSFAAVMLIIGGVWAVITGVAAIAEDEFFVTTAKWVFEFDVTTWGVIHLIAGGILILSGIGLFSGNVAARVVGVIAAGLSAIANFAWLPYYPVWSIVMIAVAVAVIWALTAHGHDLAAR